MLKRSLNEYMKYCVETKMNVEIASKLPYEKRWMFLRTEK